MMHICDKILCFITVFTTKESLHFHFTAYVCGVTDKSMQNEPQHCTIWQVDEKCIVQSPGASQKLVGNYCDSGIKVEYQCSAQ